MKVLKVVFSMIPWRGFFMILFCVAVIPVSAEMRTWTSVSGATVEAELERVSGGRAYLKAPNGKQFAIGMTSLSEADREYIQSQQKPDASGGSLFPSSTPKDAAPAPQPTAENRFPYAAAASLEGGLPGSIQLRHPDNAKFLLIQYGPGARDVLYAVFDPPEPRTTADVAYLWSPSLPGYQTPRKMEGDSEDVAGNDAYIFEVPVTTQFGNLRVKGTLELASGASKWWLIFAKLDAEISEGVKSSGFQVGAYVNESLADVSDMATAKPVRFLGEPRLSVGYNASRRSSSGSLKLGGMTLVPGKGMDDEIELVYLDTDGDEEDEKEWELTEQILFSSGHGGAFRYSPKELEPGQPYTVRASIDLGPIFGVQEDEKTFKTIKK